jgi:hypothetical protein
MEDETCPQLSANLIIWVFRQYSFTIACMCSGGLCRQTFEVVGNRYVPKGLSAEQKAMAQWSAHLAVERPFECSPIDVVDIATKVSVSEQGEKK